MDEKTAILAIKDFREALPKIKDHIDSPEDFIKAFEWISKKIISSKYLVLSSNGLSRKAKVSTGAFIAAMWYSGYEIVGQNDYSVFYRVDYQG